MFTKEQLNSLYRYATALAHDEIRAFDLVHSSLVRVLKKQPTYPLSYMRTTIRNIFYDELRKKTRVQIESIGDAENIIAINDTSLEDIVIERDYLQNILNELEPIDREILYLYSVEEMTFTEIANQLGKKKGTLLSRLHRLRKKINSQEEGADAVIS